jgi:hypothetical protein
MIISVKVVYKRSTFVRKLEEMGFTNELGMSDATVELLFKNWGYAAVNLKDLTWDVFIIFTLNDGFPEDIEEWSLSKLKKWVEKNPDRFRAKKSAAKYGV